MNVFVFIILGAAVSTLLLMVAILYSESRTLENTEEELENWEMTLADKLAKLDEDNTINDTNYVKTKAKNKK